jgi:hemerythrin-like domain-containing protein
MTNPLSLPRRQVLLGSALAAGAVLSGCAGNRADRDGANEKDPRDEVAPGEDLMREHGVLRRVMMIYDDAALRLETGGLDVDPGVLSQANAIVKTFIQEYHEKLEENYLFPRFEKSGVQKDLVAILRQQHGVGRRLTGQIQSLSSGVRIVDPNDRRELAGVMRRFTRMYRPHAAREDTVLYPALRQVVSASEYDALGEDFEKQENELFGADGFEATVAKVATLERKVGLFDLSQFTPS